MTHIWRQAIIWTNAGILLIRPLGTNFSEILIGIQAFSLTKMHCKMSSAKWRPFRLGLNVLKNAYFIPRMSDCSRCIKQTDMDKELSACRGIK